MQIEGALRQILYSVLFPLFNDGYIFEQNYAFFGNRVVVSGLKKADFTFFLKLDEYWCNNVKEKFVTLHAINTKLSLCRRLLQIE